MVQQPPGCLLLAADFEWNVRGRRSGLRRPLWRSWLVPCLPLQPHPHDRSLLSWAWV